MDVSNMYDHLYPYYARLFPFCDFYRWLSYGSGDLFQKREFAFTLQNDVFIRYQSYASYQFLQQDMMQRLPIKMDLGPIYNHRPHQHARTKRFRPVQRELVFDIDMSDYDEVRSCCTGANVCVKCWKFLAVACKILDAALRSDFGFEHILWVYSGRRGIHCWVCDSKARTLTRMGRESVAGYLHVVLGGKFTTKTVSLPDKKIHYSIMQALKIIEQTFIPMCIEEQNILGTDEGIKKFMVMLPDNQCKNEVQILFAKCNTSKSRWDAFIDYVEKKKMEGGDTLPKYRHLIQETMLHYAYPRMDLNVTKGMGHLLKAPFCVHPETGRICIPFSANTVDEFDPNKVPTVISVINDIEEFGKKAQASQDSTRKKIKDYQKTSLVTPIGIFHEFLKHLEESRKGQANEESGSRMEF